MGRIPGLRKNHFAQRVVSRLHFTRREWYLLRSPPDREPPSISHTTRSTSVQEEQQRALECYRLVVPISGSGQTMPVLTTNQTVFNGSRDIFPIDL
jgi:hypothetical protein